MRMMIISIISNWNYGWGANLDGVHVVAGGFLEKSTSIATGPEPHLNIALFNLLI